jgi:hypothetical protein
MALALCLALGLSALGGIYWAYQSDSKPDSPDPRAAFEQVRERVEQAMNEPRILNASVERNPNPFACLYTATADCRQGGGLFLLYEGVEPSAQTISQLNRNNGLSIEGFGCRGFPGPSCPIRVEAEWAPVCGASGPCENTRSARITARVILSSGEITDEWSKESLVTPTLKLSEAVTCERGGGVWALTECLSHDQAAQRELASRGEARERFDPRLLERPDDPPPAAEPQEAPRVSCDNEIMIQGEAYPLQYISHNRAQAFVPAMNGCPAEDLFVFQCQPKSPDDPYGQWIQIEAKMAPGCDEQGRPMESIGNR